jgi:hypothetical protein
MDIMGKIPIENGGGVKTFCRIMFLVSGAVMIYIAVMLFFTTAEIFVPEGEGPPIPAAFFSLAVVGLLAVLTGLTLRTKLLMVSNWIGFKLLALTVIFMTAQALYEPAVLEPFTVIFPVGSDVSRYWIIVLAIAAVTQVYQTAVDVAEYRLIDSYILTKSVTRALFLLVFLPVYFYMGWFVLPENGQNLTSFALAGTFSYFAVFFSLIRIKVDENANRSPAKMIIYTLLCMLAFAVYAFVLQLLWTHLAVIFSLGILPLLLFAFVIFWTIGKWETHEHKVIGNYVCDWCDTEDVGLYQFCSTDCQDIANEPVGRQCATCKGYYEITRLQLKKGRYSVYCRPACAPVIEYYCSRCNRKLYSIASSCNCGKY